MTDVYIEDPEDEVPSPGTIARMRADLARMESLAYRYASDTAGNVVDETRMLALRARRKINANLGTSAAIALGSGLALGLAAALFAAYRRHPRDKRR
jgi:hypothetical protein